ncbi:heterokaryon incompatibility protein-domain-containing protein [Lasiosphaeria ovina]|uniref:Heterokaryon incompatibility protein-domain-containing protein n=1 Tax=Lasiosphaeria ovina TaxID=92902 RepID=A0AAE0N439_9PEZI|nr:heterokaryon incompatibility protein-domain-containing protein [Lasiosphaeria ovina]
MASSATAATTFYKPVLTRPSEWPAWYTALKKVAGDRDLGGAVDINNDNWTPLTKVIISDYEDFLDHRYPQATRRTDEEKRGLADNATAQQMQAWRSFEARQLLDYKAYKEQRALIREVKEWIRTSTAATYANPAEPEDATLKAIVKKLHSLVSISTEVEVERARQAYRAVLKKPNKSISPAKWLLQWQKAYSEAVRLDICEIEGTLALKDFARAVGLYDPSWMSIMMMDTVKAELAGSAQKDLPYYANIFKLIYEAQSGKNSHNSAFATTATFNGKQEGDRPTYTCPCRPDPAFHKPEKCWALQEIITGKKGRYNTPKRRLDYAREELKKPEWNDLVQKIKSRAGDEESWPKNSVAVVVSTAALKPGKFTPSADDFVQVGDSCLAIQGRGTWVIKNALNGPNGKNTVDLTLQDTAVIPGSRYIRVLEVLREGDDTTSQLRAHLIDVDLDDEDRLAYAALSYTWGTLELTESLTIGGATIGGATIGGATIGITPNLASALRHIRAINSLERIWVDAVCINQRDNAEKSFQLPLTFNIYRFVSRVIVWLGDDPQHVELMRAMRATSWRLALDPNKAEEPMTDEKRAFRNHVSQLLTHPWFSCCWII